jgi:hypothetical protein
LGSRETENLNLAHACLGAAARAVFKLTWGHENEPSFVLTKQQIISQPCTGCFIKSGAWPNFSEQDETWAEFSTLEVQPTASLKVENSAQTT